MESKRTPSHDKGSSRPKPKDQDACTERRPIRRVGCARHAGEVLQFHPLRIILAQAGYAMAQRFKFAFQAVPLTLRILDVGLPDMMNLEGLSHAIPAALRG